MMLDPEYHAFGPWIYEVSDEHPLPPLFVPHYKEDDHYLMLVKIPRDIERRDAMPGMDLYDFVIGMYEEFIYILQRKDKLIGVNKVLYSEIEGIEDLRELLRGVLTIYFRNSKVNIPFNTVSSNIISRLTKIIRDRYTKKTFEAFKEVAQEKDLNIDTLYMNLLRDMKVNDEAIQICAVQSSVSVTMKNGNLFRRVIHYLTGKILLNTLHLSNNRELIIISRGKTFKSRHEANYSFAFTYVPIERVRSVKIENNEKYDNLIELNLNLSDNELKFYFEQINKELIDFYNNINQCVELANV